MAVREGPELVAHSLKPLRILLVDDSPLFRRGAAQVLSCSPEVELVGQARTGAEAIAKLKRTDPELVFIDISMPELDGLHAAAWIKSLIPAPYVCLATLHDGDIYRAAAKKCGADGLIHKEDFFHCVQRLSESLRPQDAQSESGRTLALTEFFKNLAGFSRMEGDR
jgi:DNA-binding NarL/FixJ family response regulator